MWRKKLTAIFAGLSGVSGLVEFATEEPTGLKIKRMENTLVCERTFNEGWRFQASSMAELMMARGITDSAVIEAMKNVPRHQFVPEMYYDQAYDDRALPIGKGQTISQPYIVALMTQMLQVSKEDTVLEIGTGSGYQAAVLSSIVSRVYSVELIKEHADSAALRMKKLGYFNVSVKNGDGYKGWKEKAPFDKIIVTAAPPTIPGELIAQLKDGGLMVVPVGESGSQYLLVIKKQGEDFTFERKAPVSFVPMVRAKK